MCTWSVSLGRKRPEYLGAGLQVGGLSSKDGWNWALWHLPSLQGSIVWHHTFMHRPSHLGTWYMQVYLQDNFTRKPSRDIMTSSIRHKRCDLWSSVTRSTCKEIVYSHRLSGCIDHGPHRGPGHGLASTNPNRFQDLRGCSSISSSEKSSIHSSGLYSQVYTIKSQ